MLVFFVCMSAGGSCATHARTHARFYALSESLATSLALPRALSLARAWGAQGLCIGCGLHASLPPEPPTHQLPPQYNGAPPPRRPRIFFDGSGWGFGFALGAARHMYQQFDFKDQVEVIGVSAGNVAAICLLLGKDPWELVQELYPRFRRRVMCRACSRPLIGFCSRLGLPAHPLASPRLPSPPLASPRLPSPCPLPPFASPLASPPAFLFFPAPLPPPPLPSVLPGASRPPVREQTEADASGAEAARGSEQAHLFRV